MTIELPYSSSHFLREDIHKEFIRLIAVATEGLPKNADGAEVCSRLKNWIDDINEREGDEIQFSLRLIDFNWAVEDVIGETRVEVTVRKPSPRSNWWIISDTVKISPYFKELDQFGIRVQTVALERQLKASHPYNFLDIRAWIYQHDHYTKMWASGQ